MVYHLKHLQHFYASSWFPACFQRQCRRMRQQQTNLQPQDQVSKTLIASSQMYRLKCRFFEGARHPPSRYQLNVNAIRCLGQAPQFLLDALQRGRYPEFSKNKSHLLQDTCIHQQELYERNRQRQNPVQLKSSCPEPIPYALRRRLHIPEMFKGRCGVGSNLHLVATNASVK